MSLSFTSVLSFLLLMTVTACVPETVVPMRTVNFSNERMPRQTLIVFLPGRGDSVERFREEGFIAVAKAAGVDADMIGAEAHIGYYLERKFLARLREDVILPAKRRGYREIWLVGISLGGFGSIWYDIEHPDEVTGVVALSPYLGEQDMVDEVGEAGGLAKWNLSPDENIGEQQKIWVGLKSYLLKKKSTGRLFLAFGQEDGFAKANRMLADILPSGQSFTADGGHDWPTWKFLWGEILEKPILPGNGRGGKARVSQ